MQVQNIIKTKKVNQIKKLLVGGGKLSDDMVSELNKFKTQSYESFAMTETLTHFAVKQIAPVHNEWFKTIKGFEIDHNKEGELIIKKNIVTNCELQTRDLIEKKSNSEFKWLGRSDNIINSGGIKLIPEEIERKISKLIYVPFVLVGVPDIKLGEKIAIVSNEPLEINLDKINEVLSKYEKIQTAYIVKRFPKTQSGKIKRKELVKILNA
jgi:O-succinylbenzoic acid--CoA ligase